VLGRTRETDVPVPYLNVLDDRKRENPFLFKSLTAPR
jgi:hypothetical protein